MRAVWASPEVVVDRVGKNISVKKADIFFALRAKGSGPGRGQVTQPPPDNAFFSCVGRQAVPIALGPRLGV